MVVYTGLSFTSVTASVHSAAVIKLSDQNQLRGGKGLFDLTRLRITCLRDGIAHSGRNSPTSISNRDSPADTSVWSGESLNQGLSSEI